MKQRYPRTVFVDASPGPGADTGKVSILTFLNIVTSVFCFQLGQTERYFVSTISFSRFSFHYVGCHHKLLIRADTSGPLKSTQTHLLQRISKTRRLEFTKSFLFDACPKPKFPQTKFSFLFCIYVLPGALPPGPSAYAIVGVMLAAVVDWRRPWRWWRRRRRGRRDPHLDLEIPNNS